MMQVQKLLITQLRLSLNEEPLFISGLGLDSIDALELGMALKKKYHLDLSENKEENQTHFYSVKTIADYVRSRNKD